VVQEDEKEFVIMKITVLYGGPSAEREVSLVSGKSVADALKHAGHDVLLHDIHPGDLSVLDKPADVIFPVLHGEWGESGELQEILEQRKLRFVGSGSKASRLGMDKVKTKKAWEAAGLPTPRYKVIQRGEPIKDVPESCVVKAISSGSSIDVHVCKSSAEGTPGNAQKAIEEILSRHDEVLVEQFIDGPELTVGLLEEEPLAPIRIVAKREFFDYEAKYKANDTEHRFDTGLPKDVSERCRELAKQANGVVGARDLARIDIMLDSAHRPFLLEINTLPGFTPKSLLPEAAAHAGVPFGALVDRLVKRAASRE
jgi:D-alanine-D-alanine ligase